MSSNAAGMARLTFPEAYGFGEGVHAEGFDEKAFIKDELVGGSFWSGDSLVTTKTIAQELWTLAKTHPDAVKLWDHDGSYGPYMRKMLIHVEGTTEAFPQLQGVSELDAAMWGEADQTLTQQRRGSVLVADLQYPVPFLAGAAQKDMPRRCKGKEVITNKLHTTITNVIQLARDKNPILVGKKKIYDVSILFNSSLTPEHVDEPQWDGTGDVILNICAWGDGCFTLMDCENKSEHMVGMYMGTNDWVAFSGGLRYKCTHQVHTMHASHATTSHTASPCMIVVNTHHPCTSHTLPGPPLRKRTNSPQLH